MIPGPTSTRASASSDLGGDLDPPRRPASARRSWWVVAAITIFALALRLYRIDAQSLWVDEVMTWHGAQLPITDLLLIKNYYAMAHSLYFAFMHLVLLVSESEVALRLPSALLGALSVPLLYRIGERWLGRGTGLAAAMLLAVSPLHLYYSQEARPYAAVVFFVLLAMVCLEAAVREPGRLHWRIGFVASATAALFSHPIALAIIPISLVYPLVTGSRSLGRLRGTFAILSVVVVGLLVVLVMVPPIRSSNPGRPPGLLAIAYTGWTFATGFSLGPSIRELHAPDRVQVVLGHLPIVAVGLFVFGGLAVAGAVRIWRQSRRTAAVVAIWLVLPIAFVFLGSLLTHHPFNVRYVLPAFPPFLLLVGSGILAVPRGPWRGVAWALALVLTAASILNYHLDVRYWRDDYRSAVAVLKVHARPGDVVVVSAPYTAQMLDYYDPGPVEVVPFYKPPATTLPHPDMVPATEWGPALQRIVADRERFWVLLSRTFQAPIPDLVPYLDDRFHRERDSSWAGTRLILYSIEGGETTR